jgi:hypothetical protein
MVDVDTFLTTLYVMVDDFRQSRPSKRRPGSDASLSDSEVVTLAIFARWGRFSSERDFYRYAQRRLRNAFPPCPTARSTIGWYAPARVSSRRLPCTWRSRWTQKALPTRLWTPRPCPFATRSAGARDGWPATPTSGGPTAWGGTKAFACSSPSIPPG